MLSALGPFLLMMLAMTLLIAFHELGHFLAAKLCGMSVSTFSIGFGPPLIRFVWGETEYRFCPILFGGYVRILGYTGIKEADRAEVDRLRKQGRSEQDIQSLANEHRLSAFPLKLCTEW